MHYLAYNILSPGVLGSRQQRAAVPGDFSAERAQIYPMHASPTICLQSAPYRLNTQTDPNPAFQIQVQSEKLIVVG